MNKEEFKKKLKALGVTQKEFAQMTGHGYSTVKGWKMLPKCAEIILLFIELRMGLDDVDKTFSSIKQKVRNIDLIR